MPATQVMDLCSSEGCLASYRALLAAQRYLRGYAEGGGEAPDARDWHQHAVAEAADDLLAHTAGGYASRNLVELSAADLEKSPWVGSSSIELHENEIPRQEKSEFTVEVIARVA